MYRCFASNGIGYSNLYRISIYCWIKPSEKRKRQASVNINSALLKGNLIKNQLTQDINKLKIKIRKISDQYGVTGLLIVKLTINQQGQVTKIELVKSTLKKANVTKRITREIKRLRFQKSKHQGEAELRLRIKIN